MRDYKAESRGYFDELAPRYDRHYYGRHGRQQYRRVVAAAKGWKFASVLDVGCGAGGLLALLRRPSLRLAGADISPKMIAEAEKRLGSSAELKVADSEKLPWKAGTFDLVVTTDSLHHWPHPLQAFFEMRRVLKKGGHVVVADVTAPPVLKQLGNWMAKFGKEGDVRVYSAAEVEVILREVGFVDIKREHISFMAVVVSARVGRWMVKDPFSYAARWDSIGLDCAFCKFFSRPTKWPDSQEEVFCNKHRVSLKYRLTKTDYLDGEWFCKFFDNSGRALTRAVSEFESIREELDGSTIYDGYSEDGNLKELQIKSI
jgi:ubiquinone/menaquinone biosynthesis C-methylase UbiE